MIETITNQIKCSAAGCNYLARYKINGGGKQDLCLCTGCLNTLFGEIGRKIVPKSPGNMLNAKEKGRHPL